MIFIGYMHICSCVIKECPSVFNGPVQLCDKYCTQLGSNEYYIIHSSGTAVNGKLNKSTLGVKKVRGQSEAALQIGMYDQKR